MIYKVSTSIKNQGAYNTNGVVNRLQRSNSVDNTCSVMTVILCW